MHVVDDREIDTNSVYIGSKVLVKDLDRNKNFEYKIVGTSEANPIEGKISSDSPIGASLLNKREKEKVPFQPKLKQEKDFSKKYP